MTELSRRKSFLDFFPVPEFLLLSNTGIVITDEDTKFIQLRRRVFGDGFELTRATKVVNTVGAIESGLIVSPQEIIPSLKKLATNYGIYYAHAVLPEEKSYLFTTTIPLVPPEGLRDAVAFIIEENAPVSLLESVFDFEIISQNKATNEIKLAVSVLPKGIVNSYVSLLESAGITPVSFELESQATARAVIHREDKRPHLIVNLSSKKTGFYVVEDSVVQFSTTPAYGVGALGMYSNLNDLKAEMRKVLAFWDVRTDKLGKGTKIEKIVLCGSGASDEDFVKKFMEEINIEYLLADIWINTSSSRESTPGIPFNESLDYASALGLVLSKNK